MLTRANADRADRLFQLIAVPGRCTTTALVRACREYSPTGVRVAAELDYRQQQEFEHALDESLRLDRTMHLNVRDLNLRDLNLRDLAYIGAAGAALIVLAVRRLPASRCMIMTGQGVARTVLDLVGANSASQLRVTLAHGHA